MPPSLTAAPGFGRWLSGAKTGGNAVEQRGIEPDMGGEEQSLALAVLDFVGIEYGESAAASIAGAVGIAQAVEAAGYRRYWVSEHHNMTSLACSAPEILTAHIGAHTSRIRVGAAGIMLPTMRRSRLPRRSGRCWPCIRAGSIWHSAGHRAPIR